ncbi:MAG: hypothetical protein JXR81_08750 [Candidatus Goldbacteria bacterium]|nr:hypothetical protein [Candidatus Goldiibacteriota bacterium]
MKKNILIISGVFMLFVFCSCATAPKVKERTDPETAFVYGSLDLSGLYTRLMWVTVEQYEPPTEKPYIKTFTKEKVFYIQNLKKGSYSISKVGDTESDVHNIASDFGSFEVVKPKLLYFGSYKIIRYTSGRKEVVNDYSTTEADVIKDILANTDKGTYWYGELIKRLEKLKDIESRKAKIPRVE